MNAKVFACKQKAKQNYAESCKNNGWILLQKKMNFTNKSMDKYDNRKITLSAWNDDESDDDEKDSKMYLDALQQAVSSTKAIVNDITTAENDCKMATTHFVKEEPKNIVKKELEKISKDELENQLIEKLLMIEDFKTKCKILEEKILEWKARTKSITKTCQDMSYVMKNLIFDLENKNLCPRPKKMVRSVGVQVITDKFPGSSKPIGILTLQKHFTTESLTTAEPSGSHAPLPIDLPKANIKTEVDSPSKYVNLPATPPITPPDCEPDFRKKNKAARKRKAKSIKTTDKLNSDVVISSKAKKVRQNNYRRQDEKASNNLSNLKTTSITAQENCKPTTTESGLEEARKKDTQLSLPSSYNNKDKPLQETSRNENNIILAPIKNAYGDPNLNSLS